MSQININNTDYYYELHGEGQPIVLIAGLKGDHLGWLPILDKLAKNNQVLIFDNRGIGQTTDTDAPFNIEDMADGVMELVRALNVRKPHIVGQSMGGAIAQYIAYKYPDEICSLTLCNTFPKCQVLGRAAFMEALKLHEENALPSEIAKPILPWVFSPEFLTPETTQYILKMADEAKYPQTTSGYKRQLQALFDFDSRDWLAKINVPTLVISATGDRVAPPSDSEVLASTIPHATMVVMQTGHASQLEQPAVFAEHILNFIKDMTCVNH